MKRFTAFIIAVGILSSAAIHASVSNGEKAPEFTLKDIFGKEHSLSEYQGKYVVLEWMNHKCPFVRKFYEAGKMQEWQRELGAKNVIWLIIDSTNEKHSEFLTPEGHQELATRWKVGPAAYLMDPEGTVGRAYNARTTPHIFIIDPEGILKYQGGIDSIPSTKAEDIEKAENYLLVSMEELLNGKEVSNPQTRPYGCTVKY